MVRYFRIIIRAIIPILWFMPKVWVYAWRKKHIPFEKRYAFGMKILRTVAWACSVDYHIQGMDQIDYETNNVFCPNHQSFYDSMLIAIFPVPVNVIAKKETERYFYVNKVAKFIDILLLDRKDLRQGFHIAHELKERLSHPHQHLLIFLEGTRTKDPDHKMNPFKPGGLKVAYETKSNIVPMAVNGTYKPLSPHYNQWRYRVDIEFLKPIPYSEYSKYTTAEIAQKIEADIAACVEKMKQFQK